MRLESIIESALYNPLRYFTHISYYLGITSQHNLLLQIAQEIETYYYKLRNFKWKWSSTLFISIIGATKLHI